MWLMTPSMLTKVELMIFPMVEPPTVLAVRHYSADTNLVDR